MPAEDWNAQISLMTGMAAAEMMLGPASASCAPCPRRTAATVARFRRQAAALGVDWPRASRTASSCASLDRTDPRHLALIHEATALFRGAGYTAVRR